MPAHQRRMYDTTSLLAEPPHHLPARIVEEAEAVSGAPCALYVADIGGSCLAQVAGSAGLPAELPLREAIGPELTEAAVDDLARRLAGGQADSVIAPLWLKGRATCVLVATAGPAEELQRLAEAAGPAVELAAGYTDVFDRARRRGPATTAAELQQDMLAPRLARVTGARLAGSIIPAYDVGGDWFDHAENPEGAWLAVADAMGRGLRAAAVSSVAIGACRASRRAGSGLEQCCAAVERALADLNATSFVTLLLGSWHAQTSTLSWINCGHPPPLLISRGGEVIELDGPATHPLGIWPDRRSGFPRNHRRLEVGDRVMLYSDGVTERRAPDDMPIGVEALMELLGSLPGAGAADTVSAVEQRVRSASERDIADDATQLVLEVVG